MGCLSPTTWKIKAGVLVRVLVSQTGPLASQSPREPFLEDTFYTGTLSVGKTSLLRDTHSSRENTNVSRLAISHTTHSVQTITRQPFQKTHPAPQYFQTVQTVLSRTDTIKAESG